MANIRRNIASPLSLGLGEIGVDRNKNVWLRVSDSEALHLSGVPGSMVRVIGGSGQRIVVPSANNAGSSTSIKDAADLITNTTAFAGKLSVADTNVQLALDTLDDHVHVHSTNTSLTADDHTQYALLLGRAGGQSLSGGDAANDDLTLQGTTHATRTTSYVKLQPNGGIVEVAAVAGGQGAFGLSVPSNQYKFHFTNNLSTDWTRLVLFEGIFATPNVIASPMTFKLRCTGNMGNGFGPGFLYAIEDDAGVENFIARTAATRNGADNTGKFQIDLYNAGSRVTVMSILATGKVGIYTVTTPTAYLHLPAGTATASTGPLKLTSGVSLTTPEAGALEFTTDSLFFTITTGPTRKTIAFTDSDHGTLTGLTDDDHTQYALLNGRGPGQTLIGGTNAGVNMYLQATSNVTQGMIVTYDKLAVYADSPTAYFLAGGGGDLSLGYDGTDGVLNSSLVAPSDLNITCGANKTVELQNNVYRDINISGALLAGNPTVTPGEVEFLDEAGGATGIFTYGFAVDEGVHGCFELQHDYAEGTDLVFHVHWQGIAAPTGTDNVQWRLIYTIAKSGTTLDAATTIDSPDTAIDTQYKFYTTSVVTITGTNFNIADQFLFSLLRVASTGDAYAGDALIMTAGIHYQVNTLGSRNVTTK